MQTVNLTREVRRERILDNRNKALKVQEKQAAMMEKVILMITFVMFKTREIAVAAKFAK